jgi:hypothetical protein
MIHMNRGRTSSVEAATVDRDLLKGGLSPGPHNLSSLSSISFFSTSVWPSLPPYPYFVHWNRSHCHCLCIYWCLPLCVFIVFIHVFIVFIHVLPPLIKPYWANPDLEGKHLARRCNLSFFLNLFLSLSLGCSQEQCRFERHKW